jgi:hypothetical protein
MKNRADTANHLKRAQEIADLEREIAGAADRGEYIVIIHGILSAYAADWFRNKGFILTPVGNDATRIEWKHPPMTLTVNDLWANLEPKISGGIDFSTEYKNENESEKIL